MSWSCGQLHTRRWTEDDKGFAEHWRVYLNLFCLSQSIYSVIFSWDGLVCGWPGARLCWCCVMSHDVSAVVSWALLSPTAAASSTSTPVVQFWFRSRSHHLAPLKSDDQKQNKDTSLLWKHAAEPDCTLFASECPSNSNFLSFQDLKFTARVKLLCTINQLLLYPRLRILAKFAKHPVFLRIYNWVVTIRNTFWIWRHVGIYEYSVGSGAHTLYKYFYHVCFMRGLIITPCSCRHCTPDMLHAIQWHLIFYMLQLARHNCSVRTKLLQNK